MTLSSSLAEALGLDQAAAPPRSIERSRPVSPVKSLRLPDAGETGIGAVRRERQKREFADVATPSALIRRAQAEWPDVCLKVRFVADQLGVPLGEAWRRVIAAGVASITDPEAA